MVETASVERPTSIKPNDPRFHMQWALDNRGQNGGARGSDIGVRAGWRTTAGSRQTIVAVIDTGVDANHPELRRNLWANPIEAKGSSLEDDDHNGYVDDARGWNFVNDANDVTDDHGHGTMMAGIIVASALSAFNGTGKGSPVTAKSSKGRRTTERVTKRAAGRASTQSGANLDTMRNNQPSAPDAYVQTGTLPSASYTDPKPTITANFNSYLTRMSLSENATGVAGNLPMQSVDPTIGSSSISGLSYNLDSRNYNFSVPALSLPGRAGMDASFILSYNGKTWMKDPNTNKMVFNASHGFPAPGWNLGFGAIQWSAGANPYYNSVTSKNSVFHIAQDGARRDLAYNAATNRWVSYDSSYIEFDSGSGVLSLPNGTRMSTGRCRTTPWLLIT